MIIKHYNSRTAQTENNSELELVKIELELKNTKAIATLLNTLQAPPQELRPLFKKHRSNQTGILFK